LDNPEGVYLEAGRRLSRTSEREFNDLVIESLDESLAMVLGEIAKWAVYDGIDRKYEIARSQVTKRLGEFTTALERIFGVTTSQTMTRVVIKRLYTKLGLTFVERPDWRFPDYVMEARSRMAMFKDSVQRGSVSERPLGN
jgi:hypothetical protein